MIAQNTKIGGMSTSTFLILIVLGLFHCFTDSFYLTSFSKKKWRYTSRVILSGNGKPVEVGLYINSGSFYMHFNQLIKDFMVGNI